MPKTQRNETEFQPTYRTGAVARLTRIPVETLRVWERRYGVVGPGQSAAGHRLYTAQDVSRLALIKQLVDLGNPIGSIARLTLEQLRHMLEAAGGAAQPMGAGRAAGEPRHLRVVVVGEALGLRVARYRERFHAIQIVATCAELARARSELQGRSAEVLVVEVPTLLPEIVRSVEALRTQIGAEHGVIVYGFGPEAIAHQLRSAGYTVARAPLDLAELEDLCRAAAPSWVTPARAPARAPKLAPAPARRFDERTLIEVAGASTSIYCECQRHIVRLLIGLNNFETYSAECENRNAEDALLHGYLKTVAGNARALFEDALTRFAETEGLQLPAPIGSTATR